MDDKSQHCTKELDSLFKKERQFKIKARYQDHSTQDDCIECIPEIQLKGRWLIQAGFNIGTKVVISITENKITLNVFDE